MKFWKGEFDRLDLQTRLDMYDYEIVQSHDDKELRLAKLAKLNELMMKGQQ